MIITMINTIIS